MQDFERMTLDEIISLNSEKLKEQYDKELAALSTDKVAAAIIEDNYGLPLLDLYGKIEEADAKCTSELFFEGQRIIMYPGIKERIAKQYITCDFSAGIIYPKSLYVSFRPLLRSLDNGDAFVLKRTLKVEYGYIYDLPTTIGEFENLAYKVEAEQDSTNGIDYSHLAQRIGGAFTFQKLKRRK